MNINIEELFNDYLAINGKQEGDLSPNDLIKEKQVLFKYLELFHELLVKHLIECPESKDTQVNTNKFIHNLFFEIGQFKHMESMWKSAGMEVNRRDIG